MELLPWSSFKTAYRRKTICIPTAEMVQECSFSYNPLMGFRDCVDIAPEPEPFYTDNVVVSIGIATFVAFLLISVCTRPDRGVLAK